MQPDFPISSQGGESLFVSITRNYQEFDIDQLESAFHSVLIEASPKDQDVLKKYRAQLFANLNFYCAEAWLLKTQGGLENENEW